MSSLCAIGLYRKVRLSSRAKSGSQCRVIDRTQSRGDSPLSTLETNCQSGGWISVTEISALPIISIIGSPECHGLNISGLSLSALQRIAQVEELELVDDASGLVDFGEEHILDLRMQLHNFELLVRVEVFCVELQLLDHCQVGLHLDGFSSERAELGDICKVNMESL